MSDNQAQTTPLASFHPAIARWFAEKFAAPSPPQVRGWPAIQSGQDTLIAAPTGSGKTLAAFLWCLDSLVRQGLEGRLRDETQVLYISPLRALSNDVQKNLQQPLHEIGQVLTGMGLPAPEIRVMVRTGDTPSAQRQAMASRPPHILVTTPESFYILLTSESGRRMLGSVRTVIVDEIHAVAGSKRGSHLALSLERLEALATRGRPVRIGLSATQKPIEEVARLLVGNREDPASGKPSCAIVDEGYRRHMDLAIELPLRPLEAVCSNEAWEEVYQRIAQLIQQERTTLVFVNTRRLAERLTYHLSKLLGEDQVAAHHGSLSRDQRLKAEQRLKAGDLKALVATSSLELGIDIGTVDLVCQIGSTRSIAAFLQRVGRSGHTLDATPKGRLFALTRDELVECAAIMAEVRRSNLDRIIIPEKPLDVLAQQIVAAVSAQEWGEDDLFRLYCRAYPYRNLTKDEFDDAITMLSEGVATQRGRSGTYLHYDGVNRRLRARKGARLTAMTSGGAIPDTADYDVILEPQNTFIGTVNEDFAIESLPNDIFQLGVSSWRILRVEPGRLRVEDAQGLPPTIPFWLGEAPGRTDELSAAVSWLRKEVGQRLPNVLATLSWLKEETGSGDEAAQQLVDYIAAGKRALGVVPTQETLVLERFFDDSGGMQLVVHSPYGSRINRAWGLALRKRFCRTFNFELQAAATEDAIILSLGMQHSFPLEEVFTYLHPNSAQDVLVQALLAAPMFQTRWRWNLMRSLMLPRQRGGRKVPMPLQRMRADDLLAAVFPDVAACQENIVGDMRIPDHPIVQETLNDCLREAMDIDGFLRLLGNIVGERVNLVVRDTTEPSPFCHEILAAKPYAFLDNAPLEERRTQAVQVRRTLDAETAQSFGALDLEAIERVREQAWPKPESPDELHDALLLLGFLTDEEGRAYQEYFDVLLSQGRVTRLQPLILSKTPPLPLGEHALSHVEGLVLSHVEGGEAEGSESQRRGEGQFLWIASERLPPFQAVYPHAPHTPEVVVPERERARAWEREEALRELVRGRLEGLGPVTASAVAASFGLGKRDILTVLVDLEGEGFAVRGHFSHGIEDQEWCDRRLLARIHRYTLDRLRQEIEPVAASDYLRFLFAWHHVGQEYRLDGPTGLVAVLEQLEGFEIAASGWESEVLPSRLVRYNPDWLEQLSLTGEVAWARLYPAADAGRKAGATRLSPVSFVFRDNLALYLGRTAAPPSSEIHISGVAREVMECLERRGACFFQELTQATRQLASDVEEGLRELVACGLVTCDGFAGLRTLTSPARRRLLRHRRPEPQPRAAIFAPQRLVAGRWSLLPRFHAEQDDQLAPALRPAHSLQSSSSLRLSESNDLQRPELRVYPEPARSGGLSRREGRAESASETIEFLARKYLRRYGVVFPKVLIREPDPPPWRELVRVYRRLEARGEIRGGRFVAGFSGEQYALPEAVQNLRAMRRKKPDGAVVTVNAVDPLNLVGIITPGQRVPAQPGNRVMYRDGVPIAVVTGRETTYLKLPDVGPPVMEAAAVG